MKGDFFVLFLASVIVICHGLQIGTNYDVSRNQLGGNRFEPHRQGGGYGHYPQYPGQYPGQYPSGPGYPGQYPSGPGHYPESNPGLIGPPGAHPGCPLCDSSVYSYCSHKQIHDACCCENPAYLPFNCRKTECNYLHANSCKEYNLITKCCCVDLQKNNAAAAVNVLG